MLLNGKATLIVIQLISLICGTKDLFARAKPLQTHNVLSSKHNGTPADPSPPDAQQQPGAPTMNAAFVKRVMEKFEELKDKKKSYKIMHMPMVGFNVTISESNLTTGMNDSDYVCKWKNELLINDRRIPRVIVNAKYTGNSYCNLNGAQRFCTPVKRNIQTFHPLSNDFTDPEYYIYEERQMTVDVAFLCLPMPNNK